MRTHHIISTDGTTLAVRQGGLADGAAIVLVHGLGFCADAFALQFAGALASKYRLVAFDLRGHGRSGKPTGIDAYRDPHVWSADLAAIVDGLGIDRFALVGWSIGARVVGQYLADCGASRVAALNIVASRPTLASQATPNQPALDLPRLMQSADPAERTQATTDFVRACFETPPSQHLLDRLTAQAASVPAIALAGALAFPSDYTELMRRLRVPTLVTHGLDDALVDPEASRILAREIPGARLSLYEGCGHAPFMEAAERFDAELDRLCADAFGRG